jgi:hypothetical protein
MEEKKHLSVTPKDLSISPDTKGNVEIWVKYDPQKHGKFSGGYLTATMTPEEARQFAKRLLKITELAEMNAA